MYKKQSHKLIPYLLVAFIVIIFGILLGYHQITPIKAPKDYNKETITLKNVKEKEADFAMTLSHVKQMAKEPHASGSVEIQTVRKYLMQQFQSIGCEYQMQDFIVDMTTNIENEVTGYNTYIQNNPGENKYYEDYFARLGFSSYEEKYRDQINCIDTNILNCVNYLVKIDAPDTDQGVMFVSHYDSTNNGPGAADDLISVSSMLETLRDVYHKGDNTNDIYFLFTDAEELNLYGADAFVTTFPEMKKKIKLVINLEARGTTGTLLMFQTSLNNKGIAKELNKALDYNSMFSFSAAVYRTMPNNTDLTEFLEEGYTGINFAMIEDPQNYHKMTDNYETLNKDSAYMYFQSTVALADYFGKSNLELLQSSEDAVYFPLLKGNTVVLSNFAMFLFSCIIGLLSMIWICYLLIHKESRMKDILFSFGFHIVSLVVAALLGLGGAVIYNKVWRSGEWIVLAGWLNTIFVIICIFVIIEILLIHYFTSKRIKGNQTTLLSGLLLFSLLNWLCAFLFNSLAYIFTIPLFTLFIYSLLLYWRKSMGIKRPISYSYMVLQGIIILLLYTPCIYLLYFGLLSDSLFINTILTGLAIIPTAILSHQIFVHSRKS